MAEARVDPADGVAYTWEEMNAYYRGKYRKNEVVAYWETCKIATQRRDNKGKIRVERRDRNKWINPAGSGGAGFGKSTAGIGRSGKSGCIKSGTGSCRFGFSASVANGRRCSGRFQPGDMIRYDGVVSHYAIVVDDDRAIGYNGSTVAYEDILSDAVWHKSAASRRHAKQIIKRAKQRLGEEKYHVILSNCETFANWCYDGKDTISHQAAIGTAAGGALSSAAGAGAAGLGTVAVTNTVAEAGIWGYLGYTTTVTTTTVSAGPLILAGAVGAAAAYGAYRLATQRWHEASSEEA